MTDNWKDRVALITGAGSGIGRASALEFARLGAHVFVSDKAKGAGRETVQWIAQEGGSATFIKADMNRPEEIDTLIREAVAGYGRLDFAHNNAGIQGQIAETAEYDPAFWNRTMAVNLTAVFLCMQGQLRQMLSQGHGAIVNTASAAGQVGVRMSCAYSASKHGVIGLTKSAALDYADRGIRINAVCPGVIETPLVERVTSQAPALHNEMLGREPMGRFGTPEEVARAAIWLCSDQASFITGHTLTVDGGLTAQ